MRRAAQPESSRAAAAGQAPLEGGALATDQPPVLVIPDVE